MPSISNIYQELGLRQAESGDGKRNDELSQEDFLRLLTTQLANQDPFKPMEDGEFIAQMAQFSSVDSLQRLERSFSSFAAAMTSNQALQASTLVGQSVLVPTSTRQIEQGGSVSGEFVADTYVQNAVLTITDANGQTVRQIELGDLPPGAHPWTWDGMGESGEPVAAGEYSFQITARQGESTTSYPVYVSGLVTSVLLGNADGIVLNVDGVGT
ncbi:MAG: flagellar hook assembly protein FlgD, partial [Gammaproteobacteria bacterium]